MTPSNKSTHFALAAIIVVCALITQITKPTLALGNAQDTQSEKIEIVIPDGTEITVEAAQEITSKTARQGDPISFRLAEDLIINGRIVMAKNSLVKGTVATAKKSGFIGRGGDLGIRIESAITVDNQQIKLRTAKNKEGGDKTGTTVALFLLFGPIGLLKKGKNAIIKPGTPIKAFTDEEKKVQPKV